MARMSKCDFTSKQRVAYSFEASWTHTDQIVTWDAEISRAGQIVGTLKGTFRDSPSKDIGNLVADRVKANLEAGIENR